MYKSFKTFKKICSRCKAKRIIFFINQTVNKILIKCIIDLINNHFCFHEVNDLNTDNNASPTIEMPQLSTINSYRFLKQLYVGQQNVSDNAPLTSGSKVRHPCCKMFINKS